jgi:DNA invertase Pin-like site-specific DNA recombinase
MSLSPREIAQLRKIVSIAEALLTPAAGSKGARAKTAARSIAKPRAGRRTGKELAAFRKMILAERKRGTPVAEIARKHGITPNYIYQMR